MAHCNPIRILVVHDDPLARAGLTSAFARYVDLQVVGADEDDQDAAADAPSRWPHAADVVVADYHHGTRLATLAATRSGTGNACRVVVVATHNREWEIRKALECGVRGYILAGCALDDLAAGVRAVFRGVRFLSPPVALRLAEILARDPLTEREEEVLRLVVDGMSNKAIARQLGIAVGTVKSHLKGIFDKLGVASRTQAICAAEQRGMLDEGSRPERSARARPVVAGEREGAPLA